MYLIERLSKMHSLNIGKSKLQIWLTLFLASSLIGLFSQHVFGLEISLPQRCRTEGRITLNYPYEDQIYKYHLAFTESIDTLDLRSVVSIGYVGYDPIKYYTRQDSPTITVTTDGVALEHATYFVKEINWFVEKVMNIPMAQFSAESPHMVGPTGLFGAILSMSTGGKEFDFVRATTYRNIPCNIHSKTFSLPGKKMNVVLELYSPAQGTVFRNLKTSYFSIQATFQESDDAKRDFKRASFIIDYYNIDSMDGDPDRFEMILRNDFNLPLLKGCSKFLIHVEPKSYPQLSLNYKQKSSGESLLIAYDRSAGYMRREIIGKSVSIWDLNEELLYHVAGDVPDVLSTHFPNGGNVQMCSVLHVSDEKLSPSYRPYEKSGELLDVLKLLGATKLAFMGRGSVRDLPCRIYEVILDKPPFIFGLPIDNQSDKKDTQPVSAITEPEIEYIVQFYLLLGQQDAENSNAREEALKKVDFWPAKITLNRRNKKLATVELIDQLDVYDFYWSLDGWDKKASQLFMANDCFDDDDEQLRIEMALTFDRVHNGAVRPEDKTLLPFNKFKLEFDLLDNVFSLFQISKLHLVEYELKLSPNHVNLDLVIGDRQENKNLVFAGEGRLVDEKSYESNRVILSGYSEESCVMLSSLIADISMVVYCPTVEGISQCTAVYDEKEPIIEFNQDSNKPNAPACRVYWYTAAGIPKRGTEIVLQKSASLHKHPFEFVARQPDGLKSVTLEGEVKNYDVSREIQLISINKYMFVFDNNSEINSNQNIRSLNTITYKSEGDCARMCNLDATCKSYSYCSNKNDHPCLLSKLDVRASKVIDQLVRSSGSMRADNRVAITGGHGDQYELQLADHCDIYERNYLNMFRQTDEIIRLDASSANQFQTTPTTFECAKLSIDVESEAHEHNQHHISMFAYCATLNTCLLDQNLFAVSSGIQEDKNSGDEDDELVCRVYRKKYQTYFKVSAEVLAIKPDEQVALSDFNTVEECARACWVKFGHVCASFDYCSPKSCYINQIGAQSGEATLETRPSCLHYERDLELDELRKTHLNLPGQFLDNSKEGASFGGWIVNIITYMLVAGAFFYGLLLGRQVNDKIESSTSGTNHSAPATSGARPSRRETLFGFQRFSTFGNAHSSTDSNNLREDVDAQFNSANAIKLNVIKRGGNTDIEPLEGDF